MKAGHSWFRRTAAAFAGLVMALQPVMAQQQAFTERTDVVVIEVPVQVVRDGEPVRGLTAADFEVFEGRKKQEIVGFEVLDLYAAGAPDRPSASVPAAARRHFLMLFDLSFSEPKSVVKAQEAAQKLLDGLHPTDLVAVATYSSAKGPQLVLGFTTDRAQVAAALETLGVPELVDRAPDPLRLVLVDTRGAASAAPTLGSRGGAREEAKAAQQEALIDTLESLSTASERANRSSQQATVTAMTRSFADLAKLMGGVEGRKHVVYLSEGFDSSITTGTYDQAKQDEMSEQSISGEGYLTNSEERFGSTEAINDVEKMLEEFRRADCTIQSVDIGGLRAAGDQAPRRANGKDSLLQMAKGTGGELYENFNDLSVAMGQMLKRTGVTYVLAIQPDKLKTDGTYRRLKVEVKNAKGARVIHRPGYYSPRPFTEQSPLEKLLETANQVASGEESGSVRTSILAAPFRMPGDKAYVPVLIEVDGPSLLAGKQGASLPVEIYVYALDNTGAVHDFVTQTFGLDLTKVEPALRQSGFKFFGHVDLIPGQYSLRVLVRNGTTGASSLRVIDVAVPQFAQGGPVLLPPFFPEPAGRWLMAREQQEPGDAQVPYPFMQKEQPYIPASKPMLATGGQPAAVALVGYNLAAGDLKAEAKVLTPDGKEVGPGTLEVTGRESGGSNGPERLAASFRAPNLQPGEYVLRVTVTDSAGKAETSSIPFVVGGARG